MTDAAVERKAVELQRKLDSLNTELGAWKQQSEAGKPLEKHHTQVRALDRTLTKLRGEAEARLEQARRDGLLDQAIELEEMVLELHRLWGYFRVKLALRYVPHFELALTGAGELAWRCFEPAQAQMPEDRGREPPLVYFSGASSPLTVQRGMPFDAESQGDPVSLELTRAVLDALPVPVIGIPWFQVEHVPDLPIVAHEVGHDVEVDLSLGDSVEELIDRHLDGVEHERVNAWHYWSEEVFADVYGALALGPAFVSSLIDFLAASPKTLATEVAPADPEHVYPSTALRVLLALAVLDVASFEAEATALREAWHARVPRHAMEDYEQDLPRLAKALVRGPFDGIPCGRLDKLVGFPRTSHDQAVRDASGLVKGISPEADDARTLVAAARLAFDADPTKYVDCGADRKVLERIKEKQGVGVRAGPSQSGDEAEEKLEARARRDATAADTVLGLMDTAIATRR